MPEPAEQLILAVDLGTSGLKVALITIHGRVRGWEAQAVALHLAADGCAEQSPQEWWQAFIAASQRLPARDPQGGRPGRAVCCSTPGGGTNPGDPGRRP